MARSLHGKEKSKLPANTTDRKIAPHKPDQGQPKVESEIASLLTKEGASETDLLKLQLTMNMDLYKHHYDLFIKAVIIFLAFVGALVGYIFQTGTNEMTKCVMSLFIALSSITGFFAGFVSRSWVTSVEKNVTEATAKLGIVMPPVSSAKRIILIGQVLSLLLFLAGIANAIFVMAH